MLLRKLNKVLVLLAASVLLLSVSPLLSYGFEGLGLDPNLVEKVSDSAMDDMRGKYYGFYFSINFSGYWDTLGSTPFATLTYNTGFGKSTASSTINMTGTQGGSSGNTSAPDNTLSNGSDPTTSSTSDSANGSDPTTSNSANGSDPTTSSTSNTPVVKTSAVIGGDGLNSANGVLQLTQVPGSQNFVYSGIVINISIFNIKDATDSNLRNVLSSMGGLL